LPKVVEVALKYRDQRCQFAGCVEPLPLENDHVADFALGNPTELGNMMRLCRFHHRRKTAKQIRIVGEPGNRHWVSLSDTAGDGDGDDSNAMVRMADGPKREHQLRLDTS